MKRVSFSFHTYDSDGESYETGVYLWFGDTRIRVAKDREEYEKFKKTIDACFEEIERDWDEYF